MAGFSAALYWDPCIQNNAHAYYLPASARAPSTNQPGSTDVHFKTVGKTVFSPVDALDGSSTSFPDVPPAVDDPIFRSLFETTASNIPSSPGSFLETSSEPSRVTSENISLLLQQCDAVFTYSSVRDFVQQLFVLSKTLAKASTSGNVPTSATSMFYIFLAIDVKEIEQYLPVVRFVSFLAFHFPSILTVLYDDDHNAAAVAASQASSFAGPITKATSASTALSPSNHSNNSAVSTVLSEIDTSAHVYHTLKTCGVAVFSPPALSKSTVDAVFAKAAKYSPSEEVVISTINNSVEALHSAHKESFGIDASAPNKELSKFFGPGDIAQQATPLFSRKFDYAIVNFITYLEIYHKRHLLQSDEEFTRENASFNDNNDDLSIPHRNNNDLMKPNDKNNDHSPYPSARSNFDPSLYSTIFHISQEKIDLVSSLVSDWDFRAHDLSYNDLLFAAFLMFKHGFTMQYLPSAQLARSSLSTANSPGATSREVPETDSNGTRIPSVADLAVSDPALLKFLLVVRDSYRPSNPYHNFRHAIDVLQASFYFLIQLNSLPQYDKSQPLNTTPQFKKGISVLDPVESLTLLIIAIGHDVGHPGVTNMFLNNAKTPLAEFFDYKSILESYHSAAFQRILEIYWPATQSIPVCQLIIKSVQATDMGLHFDYMQEAEKTFEMLKTRSPDEYLMGLDEAIKKNQASDDDGDADGPFSDPLKEKLDFQTLVCCLLIKCADISNVVRTLEISSKWGVVLTKEFSQVEALEIELKMKDAKPAASKVDTPTVQVEEDGEGYTVPVVALAKGQLYFIDTFAKPLFELVSKLFPKLSYTIKILEGNAQVWKKKLEEIGSE